ncbi:hypothetical protein [Agrobacterium sp. LAD9]|uniref:hypothetical protein n=1 Tax=Agrobacterium sp. LAD9 TaxID=2055153 RepID=UPI000D1F00AB|nr:hypothetical protein [Agrobacterium sp. LAD9]
MNKDTLSLQDLTDAGLRKALFRDMSKALSGEIARGMCEDGPSSIAKLMERAFQTGLAMRAVPGLDSSREGIPAPLTEDDLPTSLKRQLYKFRLILGFALNGLRRREPTVRGMVLVMPPRRATHRDEWLSPVLKQSSPFSLNAVNEMLRLGLYERPQELSSGWMMTFMTEWGFEFLLTGATHGLEDRVPGSSGTYGAFKSLMESVTPSELFQHAAAELGYVEEKEIIVSALASPMRF